MSHYFDESSEQSILIIDIFSFNLDLQIYWCLGILPTFLGSAPTLLPLGQILVSRSPKYIAKSHMKISANVKELREGVSYFSSTYLYESHHFDEGGETNILTIFSFNQLDLQNDWGIIQLVYFVLVGGQPPPHSSWVKILNFQIKQN